MQYYFSSRTPDDFREIIALRFQKIYTDMNSMTEQIKYIVEHEQVLHSRWQQIAPFTLQLSADTEKFAQDICTVLAQHENKFQLAARDFAALIAEVKKLIDSIPSPQTVADQQQWNFHQQKKLGKTSGFLKTGLFSISRHPNFFAEQSQWWVIFLFSAVQVGFNAYNWIGALVLTALFIGSTRFTEQISLSKYPDYADYQKRVSAIIPWPAKRT